MTYAWGGGGKWHTQKHRPLAGPAALPPLGLFRSLSIVSGPNAKTNENVLDEAVKLSMRASVYLQIMTWFHLTLYKLETMYPFILLPSIFVLDIHLNHIDFNFALLDLWHSYVAAVRFEGTKTKTLLSEGSWTPRTWSFMMKKTSSWRGPVPL